MIKPSVPPLYGPFSATFGAQTVLSELESIGRSNLTWPASPATELGRTVLKRYELTEEGFKRKYKKCRPENGETFQQFTTRMKSYFTRWIDMASIEKSYEGLQDLILREQLTFICNRDLELFLERTRAKIIGASK